MGMICLYDIIMELFDLVPNWRRRQFLILDEIINIVYGNNDLWHEEFYNIAFSKEKLNST